MYTEKRNISLVKLSFGERKISPKSRIAEILFTSLKSGIKKICKPVKERPSRRESTQYRIATTAFLNYLIAKFIDITTIQVKGGSSLYRCADVVHCSNLEEG